MVKMVRVDQCLDAASKFTRVGGDSERRRKMAKETVASVGGDGSSGRSKSGGILLESSFHDN
jgi:hypothetical protein